MKRISVIYLSVFLILSCGGDNGRRKIIDPVQTETSENEFNQQIFASEWFPVSLSYPKGWEAVEDTNLSMIYIMSPTDTNEMYQEKVHIVVAESSGKSLDDFFEINLKYIQQLFDDLAQTQPPSYQNINGLKYKKVRYNYLIEGLPLTAQLYVTKKSGLTYIVNCSALQTTFDDYHEEFESVISSLIISE